MFVVKQESMYYNAFEKDIAVVNIFFGISTVFGLKNSAYFFTVSHQQLNVILFSTTGALVVIRV